MKPVIDILEERISLALADVTGLGPLPALVKPATDAKFGDYQANGVMAAAKKLKTNPRALAEKLVAQLKLDDICMPPEIAGPGFINLRLKTDFLTGNLLEINADTAHLGISRTENPKTIVVDFSCPNIAKQMHVGHLRSTIIGDSICRILDFQGHKVIRQNHIGDWGTQFGMLIAYLKQANPEVIEDPDSIHIADLEQFYKNAKARCDANEDFAVLSRQEVVALHAGNKETLNVWRHIVDESRSHYQPVYDILDVNLHQANERGESFYADRLSGIVEELKQKGIAVESDGATCVFPEGFTNKQGEPLPFIIQKSDGAFLYATTDLAAIKYRIDELKADKIIYVTDARQKLHFEMLFATARLAGWVHAGVELVHVAFGTVLGENNRPLKTRSGENVKLKELLDEAIQRARAVVEEKNPELAEAKKERIAEAVGVGAVKYADYSNNRTSDYVFSFDKMLAMDGNTAPYMQYAYARVKSIERKAAKKDVDVESELAGITDLNLSEPAELDLAKHLIRYGEIIESAFADCRPNYLTQYLYELAQKFSAFYNACPVLAADKATRPTRLLLCDLTARTIRHGLSELLGIRVVEQM
ncbi:MAG: arginine--tRNA ligase [Planctomycetota bacterium]|nr:MAG: arginine--tRNA ligase [Planctomycetota bacterium]